MKKLILPVLLVAGIYVFLDQPQTASVPDVSIEAGTSVLSCGSPLARRS